MTGLQLRSVLRHDDVDIVVVVCPWFLRFSFGHINRSSTSFTRRPSISYTPFYNLTSIKTRTPLYSGPEWWLDVYMSCLCFLASFPRLLTWCSIRWKVQVVIGDFLRTRLNWVLSFCFWNFRIDEYLVKGSGFNRELIESVACLGFSFDLCVILVVDVFF